jgi:hypothetical protein
MKGDNMVRALRACGLAAVAALVGCHSAPVAMDDEATTARGAPVDVPVLANDSDPAGSPLIVKKVEDVRGGQAWVNADNTVHFVPDARASGDDMFKYRVENKWGKKAEAKVRVHVRNLAMPSESPVDPGSVIDKLLVTFYTADDDKDRPDPVRIAAVWGGTTVADTTVGVGELWEANTVRTYEIDLNPDVPLARADGLKLDIQKLPAGSPAAAGLGSSWSVSPVVEGRLKNGAVVTLLPRGPAMRFGADQPFERTFLLGPPR